MNSAGSANQEYERALESLAGKLQTISGLFTQLVTDSPITDLIKLFLDLTIGVLEFANTTEGKVLITMGLFTASIWAGSKAMSYMSGTAVVQLVTSFISYAKVMGVATASTQALGTALNLIKAHPIIFALSALIALGMATTALYDELNVTMDEQIDKVNSLATEYDDLNTSVKNIDTEMQDIQAQIEEINSLGLNITDEQESEKARLEGINKQLELQLEYETALRDLAQEELEKEVQETLSKTEHTTTFKRENYDANVYSFSAEDLTPEEQLEAQMVAYTELQDLITEKQAERNQMMADGLDVSVMNSHIDTLNGYLKDTETQAVETSGELLGLEKQIDGNTEAEKEQKESILELVNDFYVLRDGMADTTTASQDFTDQTTVTANALTKASEAFDTSVSNLSTLGSSYDTLGTAISEYNSAEGLTIGTLTNLLDLGSEYLNMLSLQNGQMVLNQESALAYANSMIDNAQALAIEQAQAEMANIANGKLGDILNYVTATSGGVVHNLALAGESAYTAGLNATEGAKGFEYFWDATANQTMGMYSADQMSAMQVVQGNLVTQLNTLENLRGTLGNYTSGLGANTSALNSNSSATSKNQQALDQLEASYNAQIDAINAEIDALRKRRDELEEYYDDRIDQLQKENDLIEDNLELQRLQEALERAKASKSMIFQDGKFTYGADDEAITDATEDIVDFEREQKLQADIEELEELKEQALANIDAQIEALEAQSEAITAEYERQKAILEEAENAKTATTQAGTDARNAIRDEELANMANYVAQMKALQAQLSYVTATPTNDFAGGTTTAWKDSTNIRPSGFDKYYPSYSSGASSIGYNQVAVVGENPKYQEIVIGSKYNSDMGIPMKLSRGDGVVNAESARTLAGMINSFGRSNNVTESTTSNSNTQSIHIDNLNLQDVQSPNDLAKALATKFKNYVVQST